MPINMGAMCFVFVRPYLTEKQLISIFNYNEEIPVFLCKDVYVRCLQRCVALGRVMHLQGSVALDRVSWHTSSPVTLTRTTPSCLSYLLRLVYLHWHKWCTFSLYAAFLLTCILPFVLYAVCFKALGLCSCSLMNNYAVGSHLIGEIALCEVR